MSTNDPDFFEAKKFSPEPDEKPTRQHGCFFYGCLITGILALLLAIAIGIITYALYRWFNDFVEQNTAVAPRELPKVEVSPEERVAVKEKVERFTNSGEAAEPAETLVLSSDDLNALIEENPELRGQAYLTIEGDRIKGKLSLSLDRLSRAFERFGIRALRGRYFNGEIELKGSYRDETLKLTVESLEANGRQMPEPFVTQVNDMIVQISRDSDNSDRLRQIESVEIKDGRLIVKRRSQSARIRSGGSLTPPELPDQVLAPPDAGPTAGGPSHAGASPEAATPSESGRPAKKP